jgi:hypothetical protein
MDGTSTVVVEANRVNAFVAQWKSRWNRPPTRGELDGLIDSYIREEILYRQAVAMGLDEDDPVTRRRMAQKLEFLTNDLVRLAEPKEGELEKYFAENIALFTAPDEITFLQVFFDPDQRDETTLDDAKAELARLRNAGVPNPDTLESGDRFMMQNYHRSISALELRKQFGEGFAGAVLELRAGSWHGPVLSGYGVHLVYVYEHLKAPQPDLEEVRPTVLQEWQSLQMKSFNEKFYEGLKSRYEIIIEDPQLEPGSVLEPDRVAEQAATGAEPES